MERRAPIRRRGYHLTGWKGLAVTQYQFETAVQGKHPDTGYRFFAERVYNLDGEEPQATGKQKAYELVYAYRPSVAQYPFDTLSTITKQEKADYILFNGEVIKQRESII